MSRTELETASFAFVDRYGTYFGPYQLGVELARRYCALASEQVLNRIREDRARLERAVVTGWYEPRPEWRQEGYEVDRARMRSRLQEMEQVWAIVEGWCGEKAVARYEELEALREEIDRLQALVKETVQWLRSAGHPKAGLLLRELKGGGHQPSDR